MSISFTSANPRSAMKSAVLAPTFPAPITATFRLTAASFGHENGANAEWAWRRRTLEMVND
jgi:hypothetical protein